MIDGEPRFGPWQVHRVEDILAELLPAPGPPRILAVDGRSGSGKTTAAERMAGRVPGSAVVHTDDIVWNHAMFDWAELITEGVLGPVRRGEAVTFRPPAWNAHGRAGAVVVPAGCPLLVVEGVGIGRRELAPLVDALIWVQTDVAIARERGEVRDSAIPDAVGWDEWQVEELPFLATDRPWERADLVVAGASEVPTTRPPRSSLHVPADDDGSTGAAAALVISPVDLRLAPLRR
ncbi:MAG: hypothetical protein K0R87_2003 [Pseudonocardia sp.]|nr:hypothetical protein [Pseudonocardia sp.]